MEIHRDVPEDERALGLGFYLTSTPGVGGRLRTVPEDFQVREDPASAAQARGEGKYTLATVKARNWETHRLVRELSKRLSVSERRIFYTGTKDKRAVTIQNIAIPAAEQAVQALDLRGVEITDTKRVDRAPKMGEHAGNAFTIRIRELNVPLEEARDHAERIVERILQEGGFPNFFGPQRFGSVRPVTHLVGRALVHEGPLEAVWTYIAKPHHLDPDHINETRERVWASRDVEDARDGLPRRLDYEHKLLNRLARDPTDGRNALEALPQNLQRLLVSAYQSYLFNQALVERATQGHPRLARAGDLLFPADDDGLPDKDQLVPVTDHNEERCRVATARGWGFTTGALPGYGSALADGAQGRIEQQVLEADGVERSAFRLERTPHLASRGTRRNLWCPIDRLGLDSGEDENGSYLELDFFLPKGSYATCLLREVMKGPITAY